MLTKCVLQEFPCQNPDYSKFDKIASGELANSIPASIIINDSAFCTMIPTDKDLQVGDITHKTYLKALVGQTGLYHLWIDYDNCDDHENYTMLCIYVGKGIAELRIDDHIRRRWPKEAQLYVTFTEIENRLSKYYEQLFLDIYDFNLNRNENRGEEELYAVWPEELHNIGTQTHDVSNRSNMSGLDDF